MTLNSLPPTLRDKYRYIVFRVDSDERHSPGVVARAFWREMLELYGDVGVSRHYVWFLQKMFNQEAMTGVIKCDHEAVEKVRAALAAIPEIGGHRVSVRVIGVTGTIKSAKRKYLSLLEEDSGREEGEENASA